MNHRLATVLYSNRLRAQFVRFLFVGCSTAALSMLVYSVLSWMGSHYLFASGVGWMAGVTYSFAANRQVTFRVKGPVADQAFRTLLVYVAQLGVSWSTLFILIDLLRFGWLVAYLISAVFVTAASFLGLKRFAFAPH